MSRREFMEQLERLLMEIPEQERKEALEYYNGYFDDAGEEQEAEVIRELGSPGKVAAMILADLKENQGSYGEYTESGYSDQRFEEKQMPGTPGETQRSHESESFSNSGYGKREKYPRKKGAMWILIILLVIMAFPVLGGVGLGVLGLILGIVFGGLGLLIGLAAGGIGMIVSGIAMLVWTFFHQLSTPAVAMASMGGAFLMTAVGIVLLVAFLWVILRLLPVIFRWCVDFIQRILYRGNRGGDRQ